MKKRTQARVRLAKTLYPLGPLLLWAAVRPELPHFLDVTAAAHVSFRNQASHTSRKYLPETMGSGVALFDYNRDGYLDLFFVNGAVIADPMPPGQVPDKTNPKYWNRLFRNNRDGTFTDVTVEAGLQGVGYGMGVAVGDFDNDGYPDLYVTNVGANILYRNNRNGTFSDVTPSAGVAGSGWSAGAAFVDYDRDGRLDLFVSRYLTWDFSKDLFCGLAQPGGRAYCHPDQFQPITHLLFHNDGHGRFHDVSEESGIARSPGKGLGVAINDYDRDGWPDIVVANDSAPEQLFHNLRNGKFEDVGTEVGVAYDENGNTFAGMGIDFADYDNDGWPDLFINALAKQKYALFHNRAGAFDYVSGPAGMGAASFDHSGWGAKFVDYDNDGLKDLFVGQGHVMDNIELTQPDVHHVEPPLLLRNIGGKFADVSAQSGPVFSRPYAARGVAFGDFNNDGFVDLAVNCNNDAALLLRNSGNQNHWLIVNLEGTRSNRDGIGAQLSVTTPDGKQQYAMVSTASSYLSANDKRVYFGLGSQATVKRLEIQWPSGIKQRFSDLRADQIFAAREQAGP
ncbi:MAG TPA: CRTAC1 family protein [Bryobacteraceae bacterium]|nr:CRTAC1 family protein [Bryobacteraceae bacterium]